MNVPKVNAKAPTKNQVNIAKAILEAYPAVSDCGNGHTGATELTFYEELADDRYDLMVVSRCSHCHMPNGSDDYASEANQRRYYDGKAPVAQ